MDALMKPGIVPDPASAAIAAPHNANNTSSHPIFGEFPMPRNPSATSTPATPPAPRVRKTPVAAPAPAARRKCLRIDLALQGGGSHGAFTWGVLDRLLEDERLEIAGISGASAGAMNAVALAAGLMEGGREGARTALRRFWSRVAAASPFNQLDDGPLGAMFGPNNPWIQAWIAPLQQFSQALGSQLSPYQLNPLNLNPLRDILTDTVDFEAVRCCDRTQLFIAATQVATGKLRIFRQAELTADMVLASACLPLLFQAVEIDGEAYWDGGYAGNPALLPLIAETDADDLLLVQINPTRRDTLPTSAEDILDRANEVTFNASLLKELRTIALIKEVLADAGQPDSAYRRPLFRRIDNLRLHRLDAEAELAPLGASSKTQTNRAFLEQLHAIGRQAADDWLAEHGRHIGQRGTFELPVTVNA
jgi:NTE family protein